MPRRKAVDESVSEPDAPVEPTPDEPAPKRRGRPPGSGAGSRAKLTEKAARDQVESVLALAGMVWATRDDVCAPIYLEHCVPAYADALAPLVMRNKQLQKLLGSVGEGAKWIPAIRATFLLVSAIQEHHGRRREQPSDFNPEYDDQYLASTGAGLG